MCQFQKRQKIHEIQKGNGTMSKEKKTSKCRNMMYEQQTRHLPCKDVNELYNIIGQKLTPPPIMYAMVVHDKDVNDKGQPTEDNVHVMMRFGNARSISEVAKEIGDKPQYIEKWDDAYENGFSYLVHRTAGAKHKYQYDPNTVRANFDYPAFLDQIEKRTKKATTSVKLNDLLDDFYKGTIGRQELEEQITGSQYGRYRPQIEAIHSKRLQKQAEEWRKEMVAQKKRTKVIWIEGAAGTGKTSLAKDYVRKDGRPYFVSGSSRDVFQGYNGEHILLLDELRSNSIPYHDLLRILDPFGCDEQIMAPSRYTDKALACDLIVITTPYSPIAFHQQIFSKRDTIDSVEQLLRRITLILHVDDDYINAMEYSFNEKRLVLLENAKRENLYSQKKRPSSKVNIVDEFNSMFK